MRRRFFAVQSDEVTHPGGENVEYDWVLAPDMVRVAATTDAGELLIIEQSHYLPGRRLWQLPGGAINPGEQPSEAAHRELTEETGYTARRCEPIGTIWPMPGLTPARVHLFVADQLVEGSANPELSEADIAIVGMPLRDAADAALDGRIGCGPSAHLVLAIWAMRHRN